MASIHGRNFMTATTRRFAAIAFVSLAGAAMPADDSVTLPAGSPFPESVTATADGTLFVSSITDGGVVKVAPGSAAIRFLGPGEHATRSTFGVLADDKTGTLWVASNDASAIGLKGPSTVEGSWIKGFDLRSGALKASIRLPGTPSIANDFAIGADGSLYVTNTAAPQILRLGPTAKELEIFVQDDVLKGGLDGIAFGQDGNLYVNTYASGEMFRIAIEQGRAGKVTKLTTSRPLVHPDGLRPFRGGFVMVEGGGTLDRVTVAGDVARIETIGTFAGPTGVTLTSDRIWIAEGQLAYLGDPDKKGQRPAGFKLRSVPLPMH